MAKFFIYVSVTIAGSIGGLVAGYALSAAVYFLLVIPTASGMSPWEKESYLCSAGSGVAWLGIFVGFVGGAIISPIALASRLSAISRTEESEKPAQTIARNIIPAGLFVGMLGGGSCGLLLGATIYYFLIHLPYRSEHPGVYAVEGGLSIRLMTFFLLIPAGAAIGAKAAAQIARTRNEKRSLVTLSLRD